MNTDLFSMTIIAPRKTAGMPTRPRAQQTGVVLFIALIALVAMTLAAIALVRSIDTGNAVAGNLAFKQGATLAGDIATDRAISWLSASAGSAASYNDQPASGYYATSQTNLDMTGGQHDPNKALVNWDFNNCNGAITTACIDPSPAFNIGNGYSVNYIIHRLCLQAGDPNATGNSCSTYQPPATTSPKKGELKYGDNKRFQDPPTGYYRITSRITGPRNTTSYIEVIMHF